MKRKPGKRKFLRPKTKLALPDLDQSKAAVLGSLRSPESQRGYRHAIDEFIEWYCSEPRLSFNRTVVLRYRMELESRNLAPGTINVRLAAVRRLAYVIRCVLNLCQRRGFGRRTGISEPCTASTFDRMGIGLVEYS